MTNTQPAGNPSQPNSKKPWLVVGGMTAIAIASLFAAPHEGTVYKAYPDPSTHSEPWGICNGHTRGVRKGDVASPAQCKAWLAEDMGIAAQSVSKCIRIHLTVNQAAALDDTVFNAGPSVVCGSTLQRLANAGDVVGMCDQLLRWNRAGGRVWPGLTTRRMDARELCLYPNHSDRLVYPANWTTP